MKNWRPLIYLLTSILIVIVSAVVANRCCVIIRKRIAERSAKQQIELVKFFHFNEPGSLMEWQEKVFRGRVNYTIEKERGLSYVKAASERSASALYYRINLDAKAKRPFISWKWRVEKFPVKRRSENLENEDEDDFAARVYVIFPGIFVTNSKVLEYIWTEKLPIGTVGSSPYSKNIKLFVLRSHQKSGTGWFTEERDIMEDYIKMFGRAPERNIGAIAFMTNTEHTGSSAVAMYDDIMVGYKR